uniref:Galactokinase N-terminal domain-containing protein n=1 Tax=Junco hyemalis TaxID=40217 RepID=A0A8C5I7I3_JUNHY
IFSDDFNSVPSKFEELYGDTTGAKIYFAPGRVNLIGEHVDYLGGHVFPCALTIGTYMIVKPRTDSAILFDSKGQSGEKRKRRA